MSSTAAMLEESILATRKRSRRLIRLRRRWFKILSRADQLAAERNNASEPPSRWSSSSRCSRETLATDTTDASTAGLRGDRRARSTARRRRVLCVPGRRTCSKLQSSVKIAQVPGARRTSWEFEPAAARCFSVFDLAAVFGIGREGRAQRLLIVEHDGLRAGFANRRSRRRR